MSAMLRGILASLRRAMGLKDQNNQAILDQNGQPIFPQE